MRLHTVQDWTVFMLNQPNAPPVAQDAHAPRKEWPVHAYKYDTNESGWVLIESDAEGEHGEPGGKHVTWVDVESLTSDGGGVTATIFISVADGGPELMRLAHHDELQYTVLQPDFASLYSLDGDAIGLHFRSPQDQENFQTCIEAAAQTNTPPAPMLWCLNHVSNRRDATVRRGAQVKALAVCSRFRFVHIWKPVLLLAVDRMYSLSTGCGHAHVARGTLHTLSLAVT